MESYWYVIKVLPGKERKLCEQFNKEITSGKLRRIKRFVCPLEKETAVVGKKRVTRDRVIYSGYLYFEAETKLSEDDRKRVSFLPDVMGMMGDKKPIILNRTDVNRILKDEELAKHNEEKRLKYRVGDSVTVNDGPFKGFEGRIGEVVDDDNLKVEVKIFGRSTNIDLHKSQIDKS